MTHPTFETGTTDMTVLFTPTSRPRLPKGVKLRHDTVRGSWMLLAPERAFEIDEVAASVLELCDGTRSFSEIVAELATKFAADPAEIGADVQVMLGDLAEKRVLEP